LDVRLVGFSILGAALAILAAFGPIYVPILILATWFIAVALITRRTVGDGHPDAEMGALVEHIIDRKKGRILDMVTSSVKSGSRFGEGLAAAINKYKMSGNIDDLRCGETAREKWFDVILEDSVKRNDTSMFIEEAKRFGEEMKNEDAFMLKSHGAISNSSFITSVGTAFFFPVFAGIGINVIGFANSGINGRWYEAIMLTAISYIVLANYIGHYKKESKERSGIYASLFAIVGITVLRLSAMITGAMI
jgi:hypothetical protein